MKAKRFLSKYGVILAVIVILAAIVVAAVSSARGGRAGFVRNASGSIKSPVQRAADSFVSWAEGLYGYIYDYNRLEEENNSLMSELSQLRERERNYEEVEAENQRLRELLNLREKHEDFVYESARIVAWDSSNYSSAFTIGKGSAHGIELGDCAITEYGAVAGQVVELGDDWATVRTIVDVDMNVGALVGDNSYAGVISGEFSLMKQGLTRLTYLASGGQMFSGDEVLTSGSGGTFPAGLVIGTISQVMSEAGGQTTYGIVEPACNVDSLSQVFIIKDYEIVE